ncbi:DUF2474 domain-containing protein [Cupriavidus sp. CuC1]|uniref:DUF2474 domain-containing protein n=1 Tax=Cupriavidus TaxID=106589 RepID=UPI00296ACADC|nr:DUF2474 domain-containing protein [Cupriavidus sp. CV2]MDW3682675.1 DUF2474 domain-containing protein [Cupriavidus sp. CV2]
MAATEHRRRPSDDPPRPWLKRVGWMVLIWVASVAALGVAALALRLLMRLAGMHS